MNFYLIKVFRNCVLLCLIVSLTCSCRPIKNENILNNRPDIVYFPDSVEASKLILSEDFDGFFDEVSPLERQIQTKTSDKEISSEEFKAFLATEVSNWSNDERQQIYEMIKDVRKLCDTLSPRIFPSPLRIIKVKTNHYGPDVYYTKGHNIYLPENIFKNFSKEVHFPILVHEIFHIISRNNPDLRHELYTYIGFYPPNKKVKLNGFLEQRKLTNPDAVSYQYVINLEHDGKTYKAIPLISSIFDSYRKSHKAFFDYLTFDMYELLEMENHYLAITNDTGKTTIPPEAMNSFFKQIKDNTQYIIHPEEIMADNFMLALLAYSKNDYSKFSPEGKELIMQITNRLKKL